MDDLVPVADTYDQLAQWLIHQLKTVVYDLVVIQLLFAALVRLFSSIHFAMYSYLFSRIERERPLTRIVMVLVVLWHKFVFSVTEKDLISSCEIFETWSDNALDIQAFLWLASFFLYLYRVAYIVYHIIN